MTARQRGQPLVFLALILVLWIGARVFAWTGGVPQPPLAAPAKAASPGLRLWSRGSELLASKPPAVARLGPSVTMTFSRQMHYRPLRPATAVVVGRPAPRLIEKQEVPVPGMTWETSGSEGPATAVTRARAPAIASPAASNPPPRGIEHRWSADAWALLRSGGGSIGAGPGAAIYGGNQVGGVLRYRFAPGNPHRPTAYLRANAALNGSGEREGAVGLSIRPVSAVPVFVAAEGRIGVFSNRTAIRPAVMAVTEFPPASLPGKARAEFYAQAGYVGGRGATAFADGQLRIDRQVVQAGPVELRVGAGAWGGAQSGAARLDVGPSATLGISSGAASARIGLDWRFRAAGSAAPASGPAITVSAGF